MTQNELQKLLVSKRDKLNVSQETFVEKYKLGITRQYYGMIENGERRPSVEVAKKIGKAMDIEWTLFFEVKGNQKLHKQNSA